MTPATEAAVELRALGKRYVGGVVALHAIDLAIARGTITAIIGANGSGKSTLIKILAGATRADAGTVRVLGADPARGAAVLRERISYVAQSVELDPEMTGFETLRLFATLHGIATGNGASRLDELADTFGLGPYLRRLVGSYSGGMRHRLHIAVGFVHQPELALMDEPTSALDPGGRRDVWQALQDFRDRGGTVVLVTHDLGEAARHANAVVLLHKGSVVAIGPPEQLVAAHPIWLLELTLGSAIVDPSSLVAGLGLRMNGVPRMHGTRVSLRFHASDATAALQAKHAIVERLEAAGQTILAFRLDPPDLSSAYFDLTGGADIERSDQAPGKERASLKEQVRR